MMKKKIILIGVIILLLIVFVFAGETVDFQKESPSENPVGKSQILQEKAGTDIDLPMDAKEESEKEEEIPKAVKQEERLSANETSKEDKENSLEVQETNTSDAEKENICTLSVRCDAILDNMEKLAKGKETIVPPNGIIYPKQQVEFNEGESVFDVLYREMRENKIHFEFVKTPMYNSAYIEGIGNLYEFDCGEHSGWVYRVNGVKPNVGCSQYQVQKGDDIVFSYTCNFLKER